MALALVLRRAHAVAAGLAGHARVAVRQREGGRRPATPAPLSFP